jgi:hypothetical protein
MLELVDSTPSLAAWWGLASGGGLQSSDALVGTSWDEGLVTEGRLADVIARMAGSAAGQLVLLVLACTGKSTRCWYWLDVGDIVQRWVPPHPLSLQNTSMQRKLGCGRKAGFIMYTLGMRILHTVHNKVVSAT